MLYMQINIDKMIDNHRCPEPSFCEVATTVMDKHKRETLVIIVDLITVIKIKYK